MRCQDRSTTNYDHPLDENSLCICNSFQQFRSKLKIRAQTQVESTVVFDSQPKVFHLPIGQNMMSLSSDRRLHRKFHLLIREQVFPEGIITDNEVPLMSLF